MKAAYVNPFVDAVIRLFKTMMSMTITIGKPALNTTARPHHDVCGVIDVSGDVHGRVVVSMPEPLATRLASEMIGDPIAQLDADCIDAVGEIANMIAGNAKTDFPGGSSAISVPQVVIGRENVPYPAATPVISIPCETDKGPLYIDVALREGS